MPLRHTRNDDGAANVETGRQGKIGNRQGGVKTASGDFPVNGIDVGVLDLDEYLVVFDIGRSRDVVAELERWNDLFDVTHVFVELPGFHGGGNVELNHFECFDVVNLFAFCFCFCVS